MNHLVPSLVSMSMQFFTFNINEAINGFAVTITESDEYDVFKTVELDDFHSRLRPVSTPKGWTEHAIK